jgi:glucose-6-phosphate-specific signal transduction histidine kinase
MRYALAFLRKRDDRDPAGVRGNLEELDALVARTAATARQILTDLRPRVLDDLGLDAAVEWLAELSEEEP